MLRYTSILVLFCASLIAGAQPLYKWVEPDGSITFSPIQPPAGVEYEIITRPSSEPTGIVASEPSSKPASHPTGEAESMTPPKKASPIPTLDAALPNKAINSEDNKTENLNTAPASSTSRLADSQSDQPVNGTSRMTAASRGSGQATRQTAAGRKQRQCQDLQKRVVSLERRLRSRLTPEDMDNTVVHMARYQRSFDQHCAQ